MQDDQRRSATWTLARCTPDRPARKPPPPSPLCAAVAAALAFTQSLEAMHYGSIVLPAFPPSHRDPCVELSFQRPPSSQLCTKLFHCAQLGVRIGRATGVVIGIAEDCAAQRLDIQQGWRLATVNMQCVLPLPPAQRRAYLRQTLRGGLGDGASSS